MAQPQILNRVRTALQDSLIVVFTMWLHSVLLTCIFADFAIGRMFTFSITHYSNFVLGGGQLKIILDNICPTAAGLAQQWWNIPVLAKERVLSVCQPVCLSVCMSLCLSVCLSVCMSFCRFFCLPSSAQLATSRLTNISNLFF